MIFDLFGKARGIVLIAASILAGVQATCASEIDALQISANIQQVHMPYGTILAPVYASADPNSPEYSNIVSYTRAGDSAIWTGHYLAAEAFRYRVTRSSEALSNAWRALQGIRSLLDITGTGVLARALIPVDSPYAAAIQQEEGGHGIYYNMMAGGAYFWIGNTSRDQYSGMMFGWSVAYEMIDDPNMRDFIRADVTRTLNYLLTRGWNIFMPNGEISATFLHRPDQQLSFLQVGRRINPRAFQWIYSLSRIVQTPFINLPIDIDSLDDHSHYFKFNVNYINLYNLVHLEEDSSPYKRKYMEAYNRLRRTTELHGNAHFNMLDRALTGEYFHRDMETVELLKSWLQRPRRDNWLDLRGQFRGCGDDRSCSAIPVEERIDTDFLWQRSPFLLFGGGLGTSETASIDYILPYWMARLFQLLPN